jgi:hypothetical protein
MSWEILSRPWRDCSVVSNPTQDSRPGLLSAVPAGLSSGPAGSHVDSFAPDALLSTGTEIFNNLFGPYIYVVNMSGLAAEGHISIPLPTFRSP